MPKITKYWRHLIILSTVLASIAAGGYAYYCWKFPYGWSHSCDKLLMFALNQYAEEHDGAYPAGEATPEASLSLLYPKYANEYVLQGKTVPVEAVKAILEKGERLGPNSCGWHYVKGLRSDDDPRLALCWDKVGLGHFGERLSDGGRFVIFVNTHFVNYIEGERWEQFQKEQQKLLEERPTQKAKIPVKLMDKVEN